MKLWRKALSVFGALLSVWAQAEVFPLPPAEVNVVGHYREHIAQEGETFDQIGERYNIGYDALVYANRDQRTGNKLDGIYLRAGDRVLLPKRFILPDAPREGIVINLPEMRLYYYPPDGKTVEVYAIGVGREGWETPLGEMSITEKRPNPTWTPPASIRQEHAEKGDILPAVVPAGPDNPLGLFAMRLSNPSYLIHGTNKPQGVGMRVSHGCIRMYPAGIEELFSKVSVKTKVNIINQPVKFGRYGDAWYLEVHQWFDHETDEIVKGYEPEVLREKAWALMTKRLGEGRMAEIDQNAVEQVLLEANGLPSMVGGL